MNKNEIAAVLIALILIVFGIHNTVTNKTHHDHTKDAWRNINVDSGISTK